MDPWAVLDIEPTADAAMIRRAYARRLKTKRPDEDADAFQRLRAARQLALQHAAGLEGMDSEPRAGRGDGPAPRAPVRDGERLQSPGGIAGAGNPLVVALDDDAPAPAGRPDPAPRIVDVAANPDEDASRRAATLASSLKACLTPLGDAKGRVDRAAFEAVLREAAALPRAPREAVEAACLQTFAAALRDRAGFAPRQALRVMPLLVAADGAFDWSRDDAVLTASVSAHDADVLVLMLRETERGAGPATGLRFGDVRAFFALWPGEEGLRAQLLRPGPVPRRFRPFAALAPHLWALRHGRWLVALVQLGLGSAAAVLAVAGFDVPGPGGPLLAALGIGSFALWLLAGGFQADRILAAAAARAVRRANKRGLFDPRLRDRMLSGAHRPVSPYFLVLALMIGSALVLAPYLGILIAVLRVFGVS